MAEIEPPTRAKPARITRMFVLTAFVAAMLAAVFSLVSQNQEEAGLRTAIRATARMGALVLGGTFMISSLHTFARASWSKWLLAHRRDFGLAFATVQYVHLGIVAALAIRHAESFFATTSKTSIWGGLVGYVWITGMTVTSFDGPRKSIGPRKWRWLHTSGMYLLWGIFVFSYLGRASTQILYAAFLGFLLIVLAVRIGAAIVRKTRASNA